MSTQPVRFPVVLAADTDPLVRAVAAYLAGFEDATRVHTEPDLRCDQPEPEVPLGGSTVSTLVPLEPGRFRIAKSR